MARQRLIDPEFWLDENLAKLSAHARLFYIGLWMLCDDNYATFPAKIGWLKIQIFPYELVDIQGLLEELTKSAHVILFKSDNKDFYFIKNFFKYQRIDHPSRPKYPKAPVALQEDSSQLINEVNIINKGNQILKSSRQTLKDKWGKR